MTVSSGKTFILDIDLSHSLWSEAGHHDAALEGGEAMVVGDKLLLAVRKRSMDNRVFPQNVTIQFVEETPDHLEIIVYFSDSYSLTGTLKLIEQ